MPSSMKKYSYIGKYVNVTCGICKINFNVAYNTYSHKSNDYIYKCPNCMKQHRANMINERINNDSKAKEKLILGRQNFWDSLSPAERNEKVSKMHKGRDAWYNSLSDDEKLIMYRNQSMMMKRRYSDMSDEDKTQHAQRAKDWWINLSDKEKEIHSQRTRDQWNKLSGEERKKFTFKMKEWYYQLNDNEKEIIHQLQSDRMRMFWNKLSEEDKQLYSIRAKDSYDGSGYRLWWDNLSDEEFREWSLKRSIAQSSATLQPKYTELEFMNHLNIYGIKYQFQYINYTIHPQFHILFPKNPITNGKVNPHHKWDFIIYSKDREILVDVDGSIHNNIPGKNIINGFDIGAYTQFNDSQRLYQTDGLDAYVILCYNNKFHKDTPVTNIKTREIITVEKLLNIINYYNMNKKQRKKILNI